MSDPGHRYKFGAPAGGWPMFGPFGKIVSEHLEPTTQERSEAHSADCGTCRAQKK